MKIAYGNYGMPKTPYETLVRQVSEIGYDGLELCTGAAYPTAPERLSAANRQHLGQLIEDADLELDKLMMQGVTLLTSEDKQHAANLESLHHAFELGAALEMEQVVAVNTAGGRIEDWDTMRDLLAERVADWATVAAEHDAFFALEPHVGAIVHTPERTTWLLEQVDHPNLKINFDYSHFELVDVPLAEALGELKSHIVGTHVKDVKGRPPNFRFLLPGESELDYVDYLHQIEAVGYDGFITAEISAQIFNKPDYAPVAAARFAYQALADAFEKAGVQRF
ncbi:sugar phosphate isomerase/epimerase [Chloroflexi bacterium TSY]|nr:sugar phosphate isomerase/epimerase [Chloroflexi bacterium TSY]